MEICNLFRGKFITSSYKNSIPRKAGLFVRGSTDPIVPGVKVNLVKYGKNDVVDSIESDDQEMVDILS